MSPSLSAAAASGKHADITAPEPGQGLRLKPIALDPLAPHYFLPSPPDGDMSIWGSPASIARGIAALSVIAVCSYLSSSMILAPLMLTAYVLAYHLLRSIAFNPQPSAPRMTQRVCVIGGGLSGIVTLKELRAAGHDAVVFEAAQDFGGGFHGAYDSCHLTVSNHWMAFSDFPAPEPNRLFWSSSQYIQYLKRYAAHFGIVENIRCNSKVSQVHKEANDDAPMGVLYTVQIEGEHGVVSEHQFDAVVLCTGNNHSPSMPHFEGKEEFIAAGGLLMHSDEYKEPSQFAGRDVLCVGLGESGADVVNEVSAVTKTCFLSLRRGVSVATKYPMRSIHTNDAFHAPLQYYAHPSLSNFLFRNLNQKIVALKGDPAFNMIGKLNLEAGGGGYQFITKNETFVEALCTGKCLKVTGVHRLNANGAQLTDGSSVHCDVVLCNTGFKRDWTLLSSMLSPELSTQLCNTRALYKHMIHPVLGPSLSFIGWARPAEGGVPAISEMQARYLSLILSGQRALPQDWHRQTKIDQQRDEQRFFLTPHMNSLVHYPIIMEQLAALVGCKLNMFKVFFTDFQLWKQLWFGAQQCSVYRFTGRDADPVMARRVVEGLPVAWFTNERAGRMARKLFAANLISWVGAPFGLLEPSW